MSKGENVEIKSRRRKISKVKNLKEKRWVKFQDASNKTVLILFLLVTNWKEKKIRSYHTVDLLLSFSF
jgi:hypothetical protein